MLAIPTFYGNLSEDVGAAIANADNVDGIVLDFRGDPGGDLESMARTVGEFLDGGPIGYRHARFLGHTTPVIDENSAANTAPLLVMIDEGSRSASELAAMALQKRRRAIVFGSPSGGKGNIQWPSRVNRGAEGDQGVYLTTPELYYGPLGYSPQGHGVAPDVGVRRISEPELYGERALGEPLAGGRLVAGPQIKAVYEDDSGALPEGEELEVPVPFAPPFDLEAARQGHAQRLADDPELRTIAEALDSPSVPTPERLSLNLSERLRTGTREGDEAISPWTMSPEAYQALAEQDRWLREAVSVLWDAHGS
ncbi:MAG: S41 family peptidase [Myxococcota bacterium]